MDNMSWTWVVVIVFEEDTKLGKAEVDLEGGRGRNMIKIQCMESSKN